MARNFHESYDRGEAQKPRSSNRGFGLLVGGVLGGLGLWPLVHGGSPRWVLVVIATALIAAGILRPSVLGPLNLVWFRLGLLLQKFLNPIVMAIIFLVGVLPTALVMRLTGADPMQRRFDRASPTYWLARQPAGSPQETMRNQF